MKERTRRKTLLLPFGNAFAGAVGRKESSFQTQSCSALMSAMEGEYGWWQCRRGVGGVAGVSLTCLVHHTWVDVDVGLISWRGAAREGKERRG